jgi:hypothetical protein
MESAQQAGGQAGPQADQGPGAESASLLKAAGREIRDEALRTADSAKESACRAAEEQKGFAVALVRDFSQALRKGAETLREQGRERSAHYVDLTGEEIESFCGRIDQKEIGMLFQDIKDFAERRPGLLFGAALLAGFGIVRFAMSAPPGNGTGRQIGD